MLHCALNLCVACKFQRAEALMYWSLDLPVPGRDRWTVWSHRALSHEGDREVSRFLHCVRVSVIRGKGSLPRDAKEDAVLGGPPFIQSPSSLLTKSSYPSGIQASPVAKSLMGQRPHPHVDLIFLASDLFRSGHVTWLWPMRIWGLTEGILGRSYCFLEEMVSLLLLGMVMYRCDTRNCCSYLVTPWGWSQHLRSVEWREEKHLGLWRCHWADESTNPEACTSDSPWKTINIKMFK